MRIALLNLPIDNNYGGNLQRYALMKVLQGMGHDVIHICLRHTYRISFPISLLVYSNRIIKKYLFGNKSICINIEKELNNKEQQDLVLTMQFYNRYIKHTKECFNISDVKKQTKNQFDAFLVGSDQVWRKDMTNQIALENYFFAFIKRLKIRRYAYSVSFGTDINTIVNRKRFGKLYSLFDAVSIRETSGLKILQDNHWYTPKPVLTLDPTFLLDRFDYIRLIEDNDVFDLTEGKIFVYLLDEDENKEETINNYKTTHNKDIVKVGLKDTRMVSIPQWLNNIRMADFIITDSYHGVVFSIIFRRPFVFLGNKERGNSRIETLYEVLHMGKIGEPLYSYKSVDLYLCDLISKSFAFLRQIQN